MDFTFTDEQEELIRTLRAFARKELAPRSGNWDKTSETPWDVWRRMGEMGLLGLRAPAAHGGGGGGLPPAGGGPQGGAPAAYGGQEADLLTAGIVIEEICRGDFTCGYPLQLNWLAEEIIGRNGSDELKTR